MTWTIWTIENDAGEQLHLLLEGEELCPGQIIAGLSVDDEDMRRVSAAYTTDQAIRDHLGVEPGREPWLYDERGEPAEFDAIDAEFEEMLHGRVQKSQPVQVQVRVAVPVPTKWAAPDLAAAYRIGVTLLLERQLHLPEHSVVTTTATDGKITVDVEADPPMVATVFEELAKDVMPAITDETAQLMQEVVG